MLEGSIILKTEVVRVEIIGKTKVSLTFFFAICQIVEFSKHLEAKYEASFRFRKILCPCEAFWSRIPFKAFLININSLYISTLLDY